ncbi:hypothetical protein DFP72DRAFT_1145062 [Ephemerocybe angulata]|uniref:Uncharacterized protein n=1 Tax=Ephemerocybe angulata TaxID=980116 RepID=A0A8H6ICS9_9AGAR|nr:hypothetical protein DFP72DRAFT_1145062 [Tulosesus angulatus]
MSFNNAPLIKALDEATERPLTPETLAIPSPNRRRVVSEPCLPERLPNSSFLHREAESLAPSTLEKELAKSRPGPRDAEEYANDIPELSVGPKEEDEPAEDPTSPRRSSFLKAIVRSISGMGAAIVTSTGTEVGVMERCSVMRAVEESNIMFLMEVRDRAFPLLLRTSGGQTPLVHAIRIGNRDVAIVLLGAFSRYINHLEADEVLKPQTQAHLKALRTGLKLAINQGLANSQPDLIASFMQTLIMSEGDKWVWAQVSMVSRELNAGTEGRPVTLAGATVRKFATRELGKADLIASLEDYIANATADLLMMAAWSITIQTISAEHMPSYYFARDDRVYKSFVEQLDKHRIEINRKCPRQLRHQLRILKEGFEGRSLTYRKKVEQIATILESGDPL